MKSKSLEEIQIDNEDDPQGAELYDLTELDDAVSRYGPGENGQPVRLYGVKEEEARETWHLHNYNVIASNMISLERSLKDVRDVR